MSLQFTHSILHSISLVIFSPCISDSPAIVTAPSSQTLNETNPLKLYCNSTGNPSPNITWVKDDRGVINTGEALYIKHVKKSDEGTYVCVASNKVGKNTTASAMITVIGKLSECIIIIILSLNRNT